MSNADVIKYLQNFSDYLHVNGFLSDTFRSIGWWIVQQCINLMTMLTAAYTKVYSLMDFWQYQAVQDFISKYQPAAIAVSAVALAWVGMMMIWRPKSDIKQKFSNLLVAMMMVGGLTGGLKLLTQISTAAAVSTIKNVPASVQLVRGNVTDLYKLDSAGWKTKKNKPVMPKLTVDVTKAADVKKIDINETVDTGDMFSGPQVSDKGAGFLTKRLTYKDGKAATKNMKTWFGKDSYYYRYDFHPFLLIIGVGATALAILFSIVKVIMLENEIGFLGVFGSLTAMADLDSGKRNLMIIKKLRDTFVVIAVQTVIVKMFTYWVTFVTANNPGPLLTTLAFIGGAFFVLNGPNAVVALFEIDAGVGSISQSLMALGGITRMGSSITHSASSIAHAGKNLASKTAQGGAAGVGALAGLGKGLASGAPKAPDLDPKGGAGDPTGKGPKPALNDGQKPNGKKPAEPDVSDNPGGTGIGPDTGEPDAPDLDDGVPPAPALDDGAAGQPTAPDLDGPDAGTPSAPGIDDGTPGAPELNDLGNGAPESAGPTAPGIEDGPASGLAQPINGDAQRPTVGEPSKPDAGTTPAPIAGEHSQGAVGSGPQTEPERLAEATPTQGSGKVNARIDAPTPSTIGGALKKRFAEIPTVKAANRGFELGRGTGAAMRERRLGKGPKD